MRVKINIIGNGVYKYKVNKFQKLDINHFAFWKPTLYTYNYELQFIFSKTISHILTTLVAKVNDSYKNDLKAMFLFPRSLRWSVCRHCRIILGYAFLCVIVNFKNRWQHMLYGIKLAHSSLLPLKRYLDIILKSFEIVKRIILLLKNKELWFKFS